MKTLYKPPPRHIVSITYDKAFDWYTVRCSVCGVLNGYNSWTKANNRRSTHVRGQDAGRD